MLLPKSTLIIPHNDGVAADLEQMAKVRTGARDGDDGVASHLKLNAGEGGPWGAVRNFAKRFVTKHARWVLVVLGILDQFHHKMNVAGVKLLGKEFLTRYIGLVV
jgi:hypothetical protein